MPALVLLLGARSQGQPGAALPVEHQEAGELRGLTLEELLQTEVVTASAQAHPAAEAPSFIYVVNQKIIRDRGYTDLKQLLEDLPEVEIQNKSGVEYSQLLVVRGIFGNNRLLILRDGIRINAISGTPHSLGHNFSLANARRVEVVLGPMSALYGADTFSGVVNVITSSGEVANGVALRGSYGQFNTTDNSFVAGVRLGEDASLAVSGNLYYSDEPNLAEAYPREFAWYFEQYLPNGKARVSPFAPSDQVTDVPIKPYATPTRAYSVGARLDVGDFRFGFLRSSDRFSSSVSARPEFALYVADARWEYTLQTAYARHQLRLLDGRLQLTTALSAQSYEVAPLSRYVNTFSNFGAYKYQQHLGVTFEERIGYRLLSWLSGTFGLSYTDLSGQPKSADLEKPFEPEMGDDAQGHHYVGSAIQDAEGRDLTLPVDFFFVRSQNLGTFGELYVRPAEWVRLTGGIRFDFNSRYGHSLIPRAALVLTPWKRTRARLLYGEAFLAPSVYAAYQHFGAFTPEVDGQGRVTGLKSSFFFLPNPDLKPEWVRMYEVALSQGLGRQLQVSVDGYLAQVRGLIVSEEFTNEQFKGWPVATVNRPVNRNRALTYGGTVRLEAHLHPASFAVLPWVAYTYSSGDIEKAPLPFTSTHTAKGGVDLGWRGASLSARFIVRSEARSPEQSDLEGNALVVPGSSVLNLFARWSNLVETPAVSGDVWLRVTNLLDRRYFHVALGTDTFPGSPQDPRRVEAGLEVRF